MTTTFQIYPTAHNKRPWRWRLAVDVAGQRTVLATSGEGYATKAGAEAAIEAVQRDAGDAEVDDLTVTA